MIDTSAKQGMEILWEIWIVFLFKYAMVISMKTYTAVIERCTETGLLVGHIPGLTGAHSQGETQEELVQNLKEVVAMLFEDGEPTLDTEYVGTQTLVA